MVFVFVFNQMSLNTQGFQFVLAGSKDTFCVYKSEEFKEY